VFRSLGCFGSDRNRTTRYRRQHPDGNVRRWKGVHAHAPSGPGAMWRHRDRGRVATDARCVAPSRLAGSRQRQGGDGSGARGASLERSRVYRRRGPRARLRQRPHIAQRHPFHAARAARGCRSSW
jgi:hypothetical protein